MKEENTTKKMARVSAKTSVNKKTNEGVTVSLQHETLAVWRVVDGLIAGQSITAYKEHRVLRRKTLFGLVCMCKTK